MYKLMTAAILTDSLKERLMAFTKSRQCKLRPLCHEVIASGVKVIAKSSDEKLCKLWRLHQNNWQVIRKRCARPGYSHVFFLDAATLDTVDRIRRLPCTAHYGRAANQSEAIRFLISLRLGYYSGNVGQNQKYMHILP